MTIYGDGSQTRDFVNVKDIAKAVLASVKSAEVTGEVFNIGSGKPTSIKELAKTIIELAGVSPQISYKPIRVGDIKDSYADISKAKKLLSFEPEVSLRKGLKELIDITMVAT